MHIFIPFVFKDFQAANECYVMQCHEMQCYKIHAVLKTEYSFRVFSLSNFKRKTATKRKTGKQIYKDEQDRQDEGVKLFQINWS